MVSQATAESTDMSSNNLTESNTTPNIIEAQIDVDDRIYKDLTTHARTETQKQLIVGLWHRLAQLRDTSIEDLAMRLGLAWIVIENVVEALRFVGLVKGEYIDKVFGFGQTALQSLEKTLSLQFATVKLERGVEVKEPQIVDVGKLSLNNGVLPASQRSKSIKEKRPMRRDLALHFLRKLESLPVDSYDILTTTVEVLKVCRGVPYQYRQSTDILVDLPKIAIKTDSLWEGEMFHYSMLAVTRVAQCLAYRYMQREVKIRGQTVPGTGVAMSETDPNWMMWEEGTEPPRLPGSSTTPDGEQNLEIMPGLQR